MLFYPIFVLGTLCSVFAHFMYIFMSDAAIECVHIQPYMFENFDTVEENRGMQTVFYFSSSH